MKKLQGHIFVHICNTLYIHFKGTHYITFRIYCDNIRNEINTNKISERNRTLLRLVSKDIDKVFGFGEDDAMYYILKFLLNEEYIKFERLTKLSMQTRILFSFSYN